MSDSPSLYLFTPLIERADDIAPALSAALEAADVACVFLRLAPMGESESARLASRLAPLVQERGAAALFADPRIAGRANADGVHIFGQGEPLLAGLSDAISSMKPQRIVGAGGLRTRHDAMSAGELDIDYVAFGEPAPDGWTPEVDFVVERVGWWSGIFNVPCVGFAPALADVEPIAQAGADFVALGDAIWADERGPAIALAEAAAIMARAGRAGP
ncbi:MAG: thiamine phosphate synthase [Beijerinckiaceae bacterium]|nr:thiamine phosphate synthase [Beijerinckiaceae bacterium]